MRTLLRLWRDWREYRADDTARRLNSLPWVRGWRDALSRARVIREMPATSQSSVLYELHDIT